MKAFEIINAELAAFSAGLMEKPMIVVASKLDATTDRWRLEKLQKFCKKKGLEFHAISAATGEGVKELMQGLADGYFIAPYTVSNYLAAVKPGGVPNDHPEVKRAEQDVGDRLRRLLAVKGKRSVNHFHRDLGHIMWDDCGMARTDASLKRALKRIPQLREEFWRNVSVTGSEARARAAHLWSLYAQVKAKGTAAH